MNAASEPITRPPTSPPSSTWPTTSSAKPPAKTHCASDEKPQVGTTTSLQASSPHNPFTRFPWCRPWLTSDARRIVGWRASRTASAGFVLDALEQALHARRPVEGGLVHQSDRGIQYVTIKYSERLAEAGIEPSVGSVGDSYDNALAETVIGLYKTEVIHRRAHGGRSTPSNTPRWNGWTGSTTATYWSPSATSRQPKRKRTTTRPLRSPGWPRSSQRK